MTRKSYIFVRKTRYEMQQLFQKGPIMDIIKPEDEVLLLVSNKKLLPIRFISIRDYQFKTIDVDGKNLNVEDGKEDVYRNIRISCSKISDEMSNINFIPFIYQEDSNIS